MKQVQRVAAAAAKVLEIIHWASAVTGVAALVASFASPAGLTGLLVRAGGEFNVCGFALWAPGGDVGAQLLSARLLSIAAILLFSLMAMVFRNLWLILRTADGKTWFAKGATPFQADIVRMLREIGIFYIMVPVVGLLLATAARMLLGYEAVESSMSMSGVITGIVMLCLSQVFAYGTQLQADVDGLV